MQNKSHYKKKTGFTVLELIAGVFILSVGLVGVSSLISRLLWYNRFVESKAIAAYLTQEGMEIVRNIRDSNWLECAIDENLEQCLSENWTDGLFCCEGAAPVTECSQEQSNPCMVDYLHDNLNPCDGECPVLKFNDEFYGHFSLSEGETKFTRTIEIWEIDTDQVRICTTTKWTEQGKDQSTKACEHLYNWYEPVISN